VCDAILDTTGGDGARTTGRAQEILEHLERVNLFVVPLDAERRAYRYHHLFADLLQARLQQTRPELLPALHGTASAWYERAGSPADAICHALAGGDAERAGCLITRHGFLLVGSGLARAVLAWLDSLPPELAQIHPPLALVNAAALAATGELEGAEERLLGAEQALQPELPTVDARTVRGQVATIRGRAALYLLGDVERAVALSREALDLLPPAKRGTRAAALSTASTAFLISGDAGPASERAVAAMVEAAARSRNPGVAPRSIAILARLQVMQGRLRRAAATYARAARIIRDQPDLVGVLTGLAYHFGMGDLLRESNDLEAAERLLRQGLGMLADTAFVMPHDVLLGYTAMAGVLEAQGDVPGAVGMIDEFLELAHRRKFVALLVAHASAMRARILLRHDGLIEAVRWAAASDLHIDGELPYPREAEHLTLARVLLAEGRLADATRLLSRLLDAAGAGGRVGSAIEILMLRALAQRAQRQTTPALADLSSSLRLAEPGGYVRLYVDEGQPIEVLLREAAARGITPSYTRRLLAAIHRTGPGPSGSGSGSVPARTAPLAEPLTQREQEVLHLLAAGASNAEIARRLGVAVTTIQTHVHHIFGKLSVGSRTQALAKARALRLL
jgi:LuxR family maltose regulon positive regulatory protein